MVAHKWGHQSHSLSQYLHEKSVLLTLPPCGVAHDGHTDAVHNHQDPKDYEVYRGEAIYHVFHFLSNCLHSVTKVGSGTWVGGWDGGCLVNMW